MKANFTRNAANALAIGIAMAALQLSAPALAFSTGPYDLFNHPDGILTQQSGAPDTVYGLRSDAFCTLPNSVASCGSDIPTNENTFTVENTTYTDAWGKVRGDYAHNVSNVWLSWEKSERDTNDPTGNTNTDTIDYTTARIHGTIVWNDPHPTPTMSEVWHVEYNLTNIHSLGSIDPTAGDAGDADVYGWYADMWNASGTLTNATDPSIVIDMFGKAMDGDPMNKAFVFAPDGHRCDNYGNFPDGNGGDSSYSSMCDPTVDNELVARGWFKLGYNGVWYKSGTNDWLVVAKPKDGPPPPDGIPEPGTLALLGMGLIGLRYSRRRRTA